MVAAIEEWWVVEGSGSISDRAAILQSTGSESLVGSGVLRNRRKRAKYLCLC